MVSLCAGALPLPHVRRLDFPARWVRARFEPLPTCISGARNRGRRVVVVSSCLEQPAPPPAQPRPRPPPRPLPPPPRPPSAASAASGVVRSAGCDTHRPLLRMPRLDLDLVEADAAVPQQGRGRTYLDTKSPTRRYSSGSPTGTLPGGTWHILIPGDDVALDGRGGQRCRAARLHVRARRRGLVWDQRSLHYVSRRPDAERVPCDD